MLPSSSSSLHRLCATPCSLPRPFQWSSPLPPRPTTVLINMHWWLQPCQHTNCLPDLENPPCLIFQQFPRSFLIGPHLNGSHTSLVAVSHASYLPKEPLPTSHCGFGFVTSIFPGQILSFESGLLTDIFLFCFCSWPGFPTPQACGLSWVPSPTRFHLALMNSIMSV